MDPLSFALVIAQQVLGGVITDFFLGKRRSASRREIETMVMEVIHKHHNQVIKEQVDTVVRYAIEEIRYMGHEHPDVQWRMNKLRPLVAPERKEQVRQNEILMDRMRRLDQIVAARRRELGLPMASDNADETKAKQPAEPEKPTTIPDEPFEMEKVDLPADPAYWQNRMKQTKERIAEKRAEIEESKPRVSWFRWWWLDELTGLPGSAKQASIGGSSKPRSRRRCSCRAYRARSPTC